MLFAKKNKNRCKIPATLMILSLSLVCSSNYKNAYISNAEDNIESIAESNNFNLEFKDGTQIEISSKNSCFVVRKLDSKNNEIWIKEIDKKENYSIEYVLPVKEIGFVVVNKYVCEETSLTTESVPSNTDESIEKLYNEDSNIYNLLAFDMNGNLIIEEETIEISEDYLSKFVKDVISISDEYMFENVDNFSQEELYEKALELISIAENTLLEEDINNAKFIINKITDDSNRNKLLIRLNVISDMSIQKELENPFFDSAEINNLSTLTGASYINLSVNTNSITFDYLNVSTDTVLNRAVTLDVSSSLPYDINVILEGDIISNTNSTNLNKDVFSVKESNSSNFITFDDTGIVTILSNQAPGDFISHGIDIRLNTSTNIIKDVYRAVFKIEAITK